MSAWHIHNIDALVRQILSGIPREMKYGTGRPFITTYQLALEFEGQYPQVVAALGYKLGGKGSGPFALTTYLARWLPVRITRGPLQGLIEVRFLAPQHITHINFGKSVSKVEATTNQAGWNTTMFRAVDASSHNNP